ncbi:RodZ domain-containing protein [Jannaschia seohaensis]|uniref:Cytoskeletal protein RodZ n=1 Tax=Jannaschia seohaensis TaxID=475081 RepID=A0A2Y9AR61_9RHOB|nr:RodZ domain-containing protein [Jannaschia seohaensis]PWJ18033.1 cytoskeletal protein RodZ [Jannaschia seohaensis]SSA46556.1 protein RodZ, contains Xre-like HTH and DUF4115 domains [Jannaschia seohaensis]
MFGRKSKKKTIVENPERGFDSYEMRLGDEMRGERATLGKSLMDVQRELRIKASYIAAIENADLEAFDSQSFVAGYVRSYARYLGMDPEIVFARFCEESGFGGIGSLRPMESALSRRDGLGAALAAPAAGRGSALRQPKTEAKPIDPLLSAGNPFAKKTTPVFAGFEPGALGSLAVLALLVGGLGYGGWTLVKEIQRVQVAPVEEEPALLAELDPLAPVAPASAAPEVAGVDMPATEALSRLYRPQALDAPILTARDQPISTIAPGSTGALASIEPADSIAADAGLATGTPESIAAGVNLALAEALREPSETAETPATPQVLASEPEAIVVVATAEAWVRIRAADGSTIFERTMQQGETYEVPASEGEVSLRTGNTGAVYFSVAGTTYGPVAPGPQVATTEVSAATIGDSFAVADLTEDSPIARVVAELAAEAALPGQDIPAE